MQRCVIPTCTSNLGLHLISYNEETLCGHHFELYCQRKLPIFKRKRRASFVYFQGSRAFKVDAFRDGGTKNPELSPISQCTTMSASLEQKPSPLEAFRNEVTKDPASSPISLYPISPTALALETSPLDSLPSSPVISRPSPGSSSQASLPPLLPSQSLPLPSPPIVDRDISMLLSTNESDICSTSPIRNTLQSRGLQFSFSANSNLGHLSSTPMCQKTPSLRRTEPSPAAQFSLPGRLSSQQHASADPHSSPPLCLLEGVLPQQPLPAVINREGNCAGMPTEQMFPPQLPHRSHLYNMADAAIMNCVTAIPSINNSPCDPPITVHNLELYLNNIRDEVWTWAQQQRDLAARDQSQLQAAHEMAIGEKNEQIAKLTKLVEDKNNVFRNWEDGVRDLRQVKERMQARRARIIRGGQTFGRRGRRGQMRGKAGRKGARYVSE